MNCSKTQDPFRFLKRKRTTTPQKINQTTVRQQTATAAYFTSMAESKLEETVLLKQNCYDANKYYSAKCEQYLKAKGFRQQFNLPKLQNQFQNDKAVLREANLYTQQQSLNTVLKTKQKQMSAQFNIKTQAQEVTFKKLDFQNKSNQHLQQMIQAPQVQLGYFNDDQDMGIETALNQCANCLRNFNPSSYQKHIRICQRVFTNKRKPFSSQKQRSRSKQSKDK